MQAFNLFNCILFIYMKEQGPCSCESLRLQLTKKEEPLLVALAFASLSLGHRMNLGTCLNSLFWRSGLIMEGIFPFPLG